MRVLFSFLFAFILTSYTYAQELSLKTPIRQDVYLGKEISIKLNVQGIDKYTLQMKNAPTSAVLKNETFTWTPLKQENKYYMVSFYLYDSTQTLIDQTDLSLTVQTTDSKPLLVFDKKLADTIKLVENTPFTFNASIKSSINSDPRSLLTYFTYNENLNAKPFDSCKVTISGDLISFYWVPSNREALQKYLKFRITIIDTDQSVYSQVLTFSIKDINETPVFEHSIPDTLYLSPQGLTIDCSAIDNDNDKLTYDYSPKSPFYSLQGSNLVFITENNDFYNSNLFPISLTISVSDGKAFIKKSVKILKNTSSASVYNPFMPPVIGDFTKKTFYEGDSLLTFLNISNFHDLKKLKINCTDLNLAPGINSLAKRLVFQQEGTYIKVYSNGIIPYSLVNRDYPYNISLLISSDDASQKPVFKVLSLTVENRPDPRNIQQQKDSLLQSISSYIETESTYQGILEKVHHRISKPWWKKVAIITGTLSGVLTLIQSENSNKTISTISASIALLSILVTNIPSLSEKTVEEVNEKIANSKSRISRLEEKKETFLSVWSVYLDQSDFNKMRSELEELMNKNKTQQKNDINSLLQNKHIKRKLRNLNKSKTAKDNSSASIKSIFNFK